MPRTSCVLLNIWVLVPASSIFETFSKASSYLKMQKNTILFSVRHNSGRWSCKHWSSINLAVKTQTGNRNARYIALRICLARVYGGEDLFEGLTSSTCISSSIQVRPYLLTINFVSNNSRWYVSVRHDVMKCNMKLSSLQHISWSIYSIALLRMS